MSLRGAVENATVKLLAPLLRTEAGGYANIIAPYGGDISPGRESEDWQRASQGRHPAILVQTGDGTYENRTMGRQADYVLDLLVMVGVDNVASQKAQTQGDGVVSAGPGIYQMIDDVRERLFNRPLEDAAGACTMRPITDGSILRAPDRMIWGCVYSVRVDAIQEMLDANDGDYLTLVSTINFPAADPGAPINPVLTYNQDVTP